MKEIIEALKHITAKDFFDMFVFVFLEFYVFDFGMF